MRPSAELSLRDPDDIAVYVKVFEQLWGVALRGEDAGRLVERVARELWAEGPAAADSS